jgi:hypothetical protein
MFRGTEAVRNTTSIRVGSLGEPIGHGLYQLPQLHLFFRPFGKLELRFELAFAESTIVVLCIVCFLFMPTFSDRYGAHIPLTHHSTGVDTLPARKRVSS